MDSSEVPPEIKAVVKNAQKTAEIVSESTTQKPAKKDVLGGPIFLIFGTIKTGLQKDCLDFAKESGQMERLNVFVCSYGGNPNVAFNSVNILRDKCKHLVTYVPDYAKSAATLFCLGADEIVLNLGAQLVL